MPETVSDKVVSVGRGLELVLHQAIKDTVTGVVALLLRIHCTILTLFMMFMEDEDDEDHCTVCLKRNLVNFVEPVKTSCGHCFCWY